jgi:hypothetical protein
MTIGSVGLPAPIAVGHDLHDRPGAYLLPGQLGLVFRLLGQDNVHFGFFGQIDRFHRPEHTVFINNPDRHTGTSETLVVFHRKHTDVRRRSPAGADVARGGEFLFPRQFEFGAMVYTVVRLLILE